MTTFRCLQELDLLLIARDEGIKVTLGLNVR